MAEAPPPPATATVQAPVEGLALRMAGGVHWVGFRAVSRPWTRSCHVCQGAEG